METAFVTAVAGWSDTPRTIDLEVDLRAHLPTPIAGALTGVYPVLASPGPAPAYAPWQELLRHGTTIGRTRLRRAPAPGVLLTRLHGPLADPERPEGFEPRYGIIARYRLTPDGVDLQILGPATTDALLDAWATRLNLDAG